MQRTLSGSRIKLQLETHDVFTATAESTILAEISPNIS